MKTHTNNFKEQIKTIGKEIDSKISYGDIVLGKNDLNAVTPSYQGAILKSVMKQLDIDSNVEIPLGTILKYEFGLKVNGEYEYINFGNYVVYSIEKQEDTNSYKITCYDKMLFTMRDYVKMPITYPITIRDYINSLCTFLGLTFANKNDTFANYDKKIQNELYLDADGNSLGYTFRDVFDELAQVTASEICLNDNDEVEIRYINDAFNINKASGLGNVSFDDAIEENIKSLVIDGKSTQNGTPTPDTPVKIESVGYTNLFDGVFRQGNPKDLDIVDRLFNENNFKLKGNQSYTISTNLDTSIFRYAVNLNVNEFPIVTTQNFYDSGWKTVSSFTFTPSQDCYFGIVVSKINNANIIPSDISSYWFQLEEGSIVHSYISFGKYGIEVKTVGKNLFDEEYARVNSNYTTNDAIGSGWKAMTIELKPNTEYRYTLFADNVPTDGGYNLQMYLYEDTTNVLTYINNHSIETTINKKSKTFTTGTSGKLYLAHLYANTDRLNTLFDNIDIQIEEGNIETEYEEYKSNIAVIELNEPLRSLPNGVKDIAYIKNNKLYVDRYIGSVVLNGSESWLFNASQNVFFSQSATGAKDGGYCSSNYFKGGNTAWENLINYEICTNMSLGETNNNWVLIKNTDFANVNDFKIWLSTHNTQVDYELATPVTEELGEISIKTLDGTNNINLLANTEINFEMEYITGIDTIDEEFLKDVNVNFGEKFGPINTIVLSRSSGSDNIYYPETLPENPYEIKISDNQIMNGNNRVDFLPDIYNKLNGLEFYTNDFISTGICYYDLCDRYSVRVGENIYSCVMFNDEVLVTQGLEENIYTKLPEQTETDYTKADKTDRKINQVSLIVDKQNQMIQSIASKVEDISKTITGNGSITLENAYEGVLHKLTIKGNISLIYPNNDLYPSDNLYPKIFKLQVDEKIYELDLDYLNYINSEICDEFVYENSKCYVIRRIGIDENDELYQLENEIIENKNDLLINVLKNSTITLLGFENAILSADYLLQNQYSNVFATEAYVNSEIKQTADEINIEVAKKVNDDEVVNAINVSTEQITLRGNRLVVEADNFQLDKEGNMTCNDGNLKNVNIKYGKISLLANDENNYGPAIEIIAEQEDVNNDSL